MKIFREIKDDFLKNRKQLHEYIFLTLKICNFHRNFKKVKGNFKNIDTVSLLSGIDIIDILCRYS